MTQPSKGTERGGKEYEALMKELENGFNGRIMDWSERLWRYFKENETHGVVIPTIINEMNEVVAWDSAKPPETRG